MSKLHFVVCISRILNGTVRGAILLCLWGVSTLGAQETVLLKSTLSTVAEVIDLAHYIDENGGQTRHIYPNGFLESRISPRIIQVLQDNDVIEFTTSGAVANDRLSSFSEEEQTILKMWNQRFAPRTRSVFNLAGVRSHDMEEPVVTRGIYIKTTRYLVGTCVVAVIMPESNGAIDTSTEDWTPEVQAEFLFQIQKGLDWLTDQGGPMAHLKWIYDIQVSQTSYEPIQRTAKDDSLWINEIYRTYDTDEGLKYTSGKKYAMRLIEKYNADWAFVIFAVNSHNVKVGTFPDGRSAYAYRGGPSMVLTYGNGGWGTENLWRTTAHETVHIFGALDEYGGGSGSTLTAGELQVPNGNHEALGPGEHCLMRSNTVQICNFTKGQLGWWDIDNNGQYDVDNTKVPSPSKLGQRLQISTMASSTDGLLQVTPIPKAPVESVTAEPQVSAVVAVTPDAAPASPKPVNPESSPATDVDPFIYVRSTPANAEIVLDGVVVGRTPFILRDVNFGEHQVVIQSNGYHPYQRRFVVDAANESLTIMTRLKMADPLEALAPNLFNAKPGIQLEVKIERPQYRIDDQIQFVFRTNQNCYLYIIDISTDDTMMLLFPNQLSGLAGINADMYYNFPSENDNFQYIITGPPGLERIIFLATKSPLPEPVQVSMQSSGIFQTVDSGDKRSFLEALSTYLQEIPDDSWASQLLAFRIVEKE